MFLFIFIPKVFTYNVLDNILSLKMYSCDHIFCYHPLRNIIFMDYIRTSTFAPKRPLSYFQPILVAILVTIAMAKVELIPDFYTLAIVQIN